MEKWLTVVGYPKYEVSTYGRVRNIKRGNILAHLVLTKGYAGVRLYEGSKGKTLKVHRLVALHFLPNPLGLPEVNHIDEDKMNPSLSNLEWCTTAYNVEYSHACCFTYISPDGVPTEIFNLSRFCRDNNLSQGSMSAVRLGGQKQHKGWTFPR